MINMNKKGVSSQMFNWIFVLVAGALILVFVFKIINTHGKIVETEVNIEILRDFDQLISGRSNSKDSFSEINIPDKDFIFTCQEPCNKNIGCDSYMSIKGGDLQIDTNNPIFTTDKVSSNKLYTFVLGWDVPFNIINFLYIANQREKIVFSEDCNSNADCERIYNLIPDKIKQAGIVVQDNNLDSKYEDNGYHIRYVRFEEYACNSIQENEVCINTDKINFKDKNFNYITDAEILASIFTQSPETYECNMKKALYKYERVVENVENKVETILEQEIFNKQNCISYYSQFLDLINHKTNGYKEVETIDDLSKIKNTQQIDSINDNLLRNSCASIY